MSTEHDVYVFEVGKVGVHPNADTLSITSVAGRPAIFRTGEFNPGDLAVYVPIDTMVPLNDPRFAFLKERNATPEGFSRVRAVRLRGIFSMGLLVKPDPKWKVGEEVSTQLGTHVFVPKEDLALNGNAEQDPGFMPMYTDIESFRKWKDVFEQNEVVVATEKIHGACMRVAFRHGRLWVGSKTQIKKESPTSVWWRAAVDLDLVSKLSTVQHIVLYGEVYGQVQDLKYGVPSGVKFIAFDAYDTTKNKYLDRVEFVVLCVKLGIPTAPALFIGEFGKLKPELCNGASVLANGACIREGFVVRPLFERRDLKLGRVILKLVGEDYLLRKQK